MEAETERLCRRIEQKDGRKMEQPQDFVWLSKQIWDVMHEVISVNTLKRLWKVQGYENVTPRRATLDMLARYAGYADFATFSNDKGDQNSNTVLARHVISRNLKKGQKLRLTWAPNRVCVIVCTGDSRFEVLETEMTHLSVGDTFDCSLIIEGDPLYLNNLIHNGEDPMLYVVGKKRGIHFEVLEE